MIRFYEERRDNANKSQEIIKPAPPIGVIAPNHLVFVRTSRYREPEKMQVAPIISHVMVLRRLDGILSASEDDRKRAPREWINWYNTAFSQIDRYSGEIECFSP